MVKANGGKATIPKLIIMKVSIIWIKSMVMEYLIGKVETFTKAITRMMRGMDMEKCIGQMGQLIKESGRTEFNMVME